MGEYVTCLEAEEIIQKKYLVRHIRYLCEKGKINCKKYGFHLWMVDIDSLRAYVPGPKGFAAHPERNPRLRKNRKPDD